MKKVPGSIPDISSLKDQVADDEKNTHLRALPVMGENTGLDGHLRQLPMTLTSSVFLGLPLVVPLQRFHRPATKGEE